MNNKSTEMMMTSNLFARMPEIIGTKMAMTEMIKASSTQDAKVIEADVQEIMNDPQRMKIYEKLKLATTELAMYPAGYTTMKLETKLYHNALPL